jgi:hypothetical protein
MRGLADEIPQRAFINAQIILRALRCGALKQATQDVCQQQHEDLLPYDLNNPAFHASLLYCLIVFPKEFYDSVALTDATKDLNDNAEIIIKLFEIKIWKDRPETNNIYNLNNQGLVTKIRNAVAHGQIIVDRSSTYTFWDQRNERSEPTFQCKITIENLSEFLSIVGRTLANIRPYRNSTGAAPPS